MPWQRFRVQLVDREPVEVQTTARDWAPVRMDTDGGLAAMGFTFQVVHNALRRTQVEGVPRAYDEFLDALDGMPEALDDEPVELDPTNAAPSDTPP